MHRVVNTYSSITINGKKIEKHSHTETINSLRYNPTPASNVTKKNGPADKESNNSAQNADLKINNVDLLTKTNGPNHKTDQYDVMNRSGAERQLVIRRGQEFYIILHLNRKYNEKTDSVLISFSLDGVSPSPKNGTLAIVPIDKDQVLSSQWHATIHEKKTGYVIVKIFTPSNMIIGKWNVEINVVNKNSQKSVCRFNIPRPIYILFNPWCTDDEVFFEGENERKEYVLADSGYVWRQEKDNPIYWSYSQFAEDVLDCAIYLMTEIAKVNVKYRNDPVKITRKLTAAVNANDDDNGVLNGKWSQDKEDFEDGTAPWLWTGSDKILQQYYREKRTVNYGQCWVFAAVLTTVCRALGIPSRVVTNYDSAHDTEGSLTIDSYFDDKAKEVHGITNDSVWNFHVWSEVWMKRLDIGDSKYDGWQVIDATPQEASGGIYCCGPMSVAAIKNGDIMLPYDGKFIYSEVNADQVQWKYHGRNRPLKLMSKDTDSIGKDISTKAMGRWKREDITHQYKHSEGSNSERLSFQTALNKCDHRCSRYYLNEEFSNVQFDFKVSTRFNEIENSYGATLTVKNTDESKEHKVSVICRTQLKYYTGRNMAESRKALENEYTVAPGDVQIISVDLNKFIAEYRPKIIEDSNISVYCLAKVQETNFEYLTKDFIRVPKPGVIYIKKHDDAVVVGNELNVTASFINPLNVTLVNGEFTVHAVGFNKKTLKYRIMEPSEPGVTTMCNIMLIPQHEGHGSITVTFISSQLKKIESFINFDIIKPGV